MVDGKRASSAIGVVLHSPKGLLIGKLSGSLGEIVKRGKKKDEIFWKVVEDRGRFWNILERLFFGNLMRFRYISNI